MPDLKLPLATPLDREGRREEGRNGAGEGLTAKADQLDHKKYSTLKITIFAYILQVGPSLPLPPLPLEVGP